MNRILVTGGAGFLGSNLCARLLQNPENQVTVLDNLFTGRKSNIEPFLQNPRCRFIEGDVKQWQDIPCGQI